MTENKQKKHKKLFFASGLISGVILIVLGFFTFQFIKPEVKPGVVETIIVCNDGRQYSASMNGCDTELNSYNVFLMNRLCRIGKSCNFEEKEILLKNGFVERRDLVLIVVSINRQVQEQDVIKEFELQYASKRD